MKRTHLAAVALAGCMLMVAPRGADATSTYRNAWLNAYPDACSTLVAAANNCTLCHTSVPSRNAYGNDIRNSNGPAIESLDSDGDGYTNGQEILLDCTLPGSAGDHGTVPNESTTWSAILALFR